MSDKNRRKESAKDDKSDEIKEHDLAKEVIKDPNVPVNVTILCGYVGKSSSEDSIRLYTSLEFNEYIEIKKDDISGSKQVSDDVLPFGGTCIFVNADAEVNHVIVEVTKEQAKFLGGIISEDLVRPTTGGAARRRRRQARIVRRIQPRTRIDFDCGPFMAPVVDTDRSCLRTYCVSNCDTCPRFCDPEPNTAMTCRTDCDTACRTECANTVCECSFIRPCGSLSDPICPGPTRQFPRCQPE